MSKDRLKAAIAVTRNQETDEFLLLRRSQDDEVLPGKWEFPSGGFEDEDSGADDAVLRELNEETGLRGEIIRKADKGEKEFEDYIQEFHIFLVEAESKQIELSEEHSDYKWCDLSQIQDLEVAEGVKLNLEALDIT